MPHRRGADAWWSRRASNGCGQAFFNQKTWAKPKDVLRPRMVVFMSCRGIRFEDTTFKDSPVWTMWIRRCEDIVASRIRVDADQRMINSDGIDFDACRNVQVGDSYFSTGDDCLILRLIFHAGDTAEAVTENVVVSNCFLSTPCQGVRIACPSDHVIRNAVFCNMTFRGTNAIFADQQHWYLEKGNTGNVTFRNIKIRSAKPIAICGNATSVVRDVTLENITGVTKANPPLRQSRTENLKIVNLDLKSVK